MSDVSIPLPGSPPAAITQAMTSKEIASHTFRTAAPGMGSALVHQEPEVARAMLYLWLMLHDQDVERAAKIRGAQECREMMARFVEVSDSITAASIRANWSPSWGPDPGPP